MKTPILGGSYIAKSPNDADARMVNLYPEAIPEGGKEPGFLSRCPGLRLLTILGSGPIRGLYTFGNYGYVASGNELYRVDSSFSSVLLGNIAGSSQVSMSDNGVQLFIATNPNGYIYDTNTGVFQQIVDPDFAGAQTVSYIDSFFVFNQPNTQIFWATNSLDGTSIDSLDFASAEGAPDLLIALIVDHLEVWLFGINSVEVWYVTGGEGFPFSRIQGAFLEIGCAAAYSIAKLDNSLFWLGSDARGNGVVYRANGYSGVRVSNHAVEGAIQSYSTISDAVAFTYQQRGHAFYVISFPSGNATWCYDASTNEWHERAYFNTVTSSFERHRANCMMNFNSTIVVGDYQNGKLYALDESVYSDAGNPQKWLRSWRALPTGQNNLKRTAQHSLQLDCESGVGLNTGQGSDPQVLLRWSDDGGHTWSNGHSRSMGKIGETGRHVYWRRLGFTSKLRDRIFEISGTDPVNIEITGAELLLTPTNA